MSERDNCMNHESSIDAFKCELCGEDAVSAVRDYSTSHGSGLYATNSPSGSWHFYCHVHNRDPVQLFVGDPVIIGIIR